MKKLKPLFVILTTALILFSAVCFLYPAISNAINEQYNESRIDDYNNNVDSISQEDIDDYFSAAEKYNKALATDVSTDDSKLSILSHYDEILDLDNGVPVHRCEHRLGSNRSALRYRCGSFRELSCGQSGNGCSI